MSEPPLETIREHIGAFRHTFIRCMATVLITTCICFCFHQKIIEIMTRPVSLSSTSSIVSSPWLRQDIRKERMLNQSHQLQYYTPASESIKVIQTSPDVIVYGSGHYQIPPGGYLDLEIATPLQRLVLLGPLDGVIPVLKLCTWLGGLLSSPVWLYFLLQFVQPALYAEERKLLFPFMGFSLVFLTLGCLFSYNFVIPVANHYFAAFNSHIGINMWTFSNYLNYTVFMGLSCAFAFELSLFVFLLVHYRILSTDGLVSNRRAVILGAFILGAVLTPPDVVTQLAVALPLVGLYELAILYSRLRKARTICCGRE